MKVLLSAIAFALLLVGCSERTDRIEMKAGSRDALLDTPYYRVKDFRLFSGAEAEIYSAYAEVDYFIYKDMALHEKRKYRYDVSARQWDRYYKTLFFGADSLGNNK